MYTHIIQFHQHIYGRDHGAYIERELISDLFLYSFSFE